MQAKKKRKIKTADHPFFGMNKGEKGNPSEIVERMRRERPHPSVS